MSTEPPTGEVYQTCPICEGQAWTVQRRGAFSRRKKGKAYVIGRSSRWIYIHAPCPRCGGAIGPPGPSDLDIRMWVVREAFLWPLESVGFPIRGQLTTSTGKVLGDAISGELGKRNGDP